MIERINLTLFNKVRAVLIQSNSPSYLWGEALEAITYIYNRTPHRALSFKTPYELLNGVKPNILNIKTWGSLAYYHTNEYISKLSPRKEEAIIIGYSEYNHYKLWDYKRQRSLWSRDITICENKFLDRPPRNIYPYINKPNNIELNSPNYTEFINSKRSNIDHNNNNNNNRIITREESSRIAANPNHRVEVQIPILLYTIKDTILANYISSIETNIDSRFILTTSLLSEPNSYIEAINSPEKDE